MQKKEALAYECKWRRNNASREGSAGSVQAWVRERRQGMAQQSQEYTTDAEEMARRVLRFDSSQCDIPAGKKEQRGENAGRY